jgi:endonuclease III related protein
LKNAEPQAAQRLLRWYRVLSRAFGPQRWWPARTPFEVMVGAILTQNTSWSNVEKAIRLLRDRRVLDPHAMETLSLVELRRLIRPAGYYNVKADRLRGYLGFFLGVYGGDYRRMARQPVESLREELLRVKGIGPETADAILLYALGKPVFVVDAYTKRIFFRHNLIDESASYAQVQSLCMGSIQQDALVYNEYHALLVRLAQEYCRKREPRCDICPLRV